MPWKPQAEGDFPTLGWLVLDWLYDYLPAPDDETKPFVLTDEQARSVLERFRLTRTGRYVYRRGASRRSKGWGKSPLYGGLALAHFAGPVRFDGWDANGQPVGRPWGTAGEPPPWVQVAAVSEDQTENTYGAMYAMLTANQGRAADDLGIDAGRTRLFLPSVRGSRLEPVTASAGSREGQRLTYAVLDETHLWTKSNGGVKLAATLRRNAAKMDGQTDETTNSFVPGEGTVAEGTHKASLEGKSGIYYDAVEAPRVTEDDDDAKLKEALVVAYGDARWIDLDRLVREIRDPDTSWEDAARFYFNWNIKGSGRMVDARRWDSDEFCKPRDLAEGTRIGVGFDGSISGDSTVLIGCTVDGYEFEIASWNRPEGEAGKSWKVPRLEVHAKVRWVFEHFSVGLMLCDPPKWWTEIEEWAAEFGEETVLVFDTNVTRRMAQATDRWLTEYREGFLSHDGSPVLTQHVVNTHLKKVKVTADEDDGRTLYVPIKGDDGGKIDGGVGAILAREAAATMPEPPEDKPLKPFFIVT